MKLVFDQEFLNLFQISVKIWLLYKRHANIYSTLYNSANDAGELNLVHERVESAVSSSQIYAVLKITPRAAEESC